MVPNRAQEVTRAENVETLIDDITKDFNDFRVEVKINQKWDLGARLEHAMQSERRESVQALQAKQAQRELPTNNYRLFFPLLFSSLL